MKFDSRGARIAAAAIIALAGLAGCERTQEVQRGYRGQGMVQLFSPATLARQKEVDKVPVALRKANPAGPTAADEYENVQVLGDLSKAEFARLMLSIKSWVAPDEGCGYCHDAPDYASDAKYPKRVAREMLRMTRHINTDWKSHVAATGPAGANGVTCYTCHRGQPVPPRIWFSNPGPVTARGPAGNHGGQNTPTPMVGLTALPFDPLTPFLEQDNDIRIVSTTALRTDDNKSIRQAQLTYALMMVISQSLGVNCTFCHNTQAFYSWDLSPPTRATAWYGIRMARDLNNVYLDPIAALLPPERLGPLGDGPKVYCATCHLGSSRPLSGANMVKDFPELVGPKVAVVAAGPIAATPPGPVANLPPAPAAAKP